MTYELDRKIEDKFSGQIRSILGNFFITKVEIDDLEHGKDFAIYNVNPFSVAVRLRRYDYFESYADEFTIRWSRPSGVRTEIDKIRAKEVHYLFYGFLSPDNSYIIQYFIADLNKFTNQEPTEIKPNKPYDSELAVYKIEQFPPDFIIKFYSNPIYKTKNQRLMRHELQS